MKKALIENSSIDLLELFDEISKEAKIESSSTAINRMQYWWTRKPLIIGRAVILASTLDNIEDFKNHLGLNRTKRAYTYSPDVGIYKKNLGIDPSKIKILDPFGGGGNLLFPANELGLDCSISDYNPLAYLIEKATLEYPAKYGEKLAEDFEKFTDQVIDMTKKEIGDFYDDDDLVYLWSWCVKCEICNSRFPLIGKMQFGHENKNPIGFKFHTTKNNDFTIELIRNIDEKKSKEFTNRGRTAKCLLRGDPVDYKTKTKYISETNDQEMLAIQYYGNKGKKYRLMVEKDKQLFQNASKMFDEKKLEFEKQGLIPGEEILAGYRKENSLWYYGIKKHRDFFNKRQLLLLITILKNIKIVLEKIEDKKYAGAISCYLSFFLCRAVNHNSIGAVWDSTTDAAKQTLEFKQMQFVPMHPEVNPFAKQGPTLENMKKTIKKSIEFCSSKVNKSTNISNKSVLISENKEQFDVILTDPPYSSDVQYGEQSEFFYVWVRRCVEKYFPKLPKRSPLDEDFCTSWGRFGDKVLANQFFEKGLEKSFIEINQKLKDDGLFIVFFAHSSPEAWNVFLKSIRSGKFQVISCYTLHTEKTSTPLSQGTTSFKSSIVVVCRKILKPSEEYFEDIIPKIEDKIKQMFTQIPNEKLLTLPITDLLIMVYGKVLEVSTRHTILKSYQKGIEFNFEELIKDARGFIMKELIGKLTGKNVNTIGPRMAFYLLIKIFHRGIIAGDNASKMAKIYDVKIEELEKEQVVTKDKDVIRLYYLNENEMDYSPENIDKNNLYQQLCYLAYAVDSRGSDKIPGIISNDNFRLEDLKQIISLLIKNYHLKRNKGESLIEKEQMELNILETLADITGVKVEGILDSYLEK